ncbi:hypothetical protein HK098_005581 [Nowakowskiella sp. JEL0407]|nr:hypothetical protein HK098_005581 [Nowakowskiella sp. JEL0407]
MPYYMRKRSSADETNSDKKHAKLEKVQVNKLGRLTKHLQSDTVLKPKIDIAKISKKGPVSPKTAKKRVVKQIQILHATAPTEVRTKQQVAAIHTAVNTQILKRGVGKQLSKSPKSPNLPRSPRTPRSPTKAQSPMKTSPKSPKSPSAPAGHDTKAKNVKRPKSPLRKSSRTAVKAV